MKRFFANVASILKSPWQFMSIVIGACIGIFAPEFAKAIGPYGTLYVNLLLMCVLPIILTSVTLSLMELLSVGSQRVVGGIIFGLVFLSLLSVLIGIVLSWALGSGIAIDPTTSPALKEVADLSSRVERGLAEPLEPEIAKGLQVFLANSIPKNIFSALAENQVFQTIIFSLILGIALSKVSRETRANLTPILQSFSVLFQKLFSGLTIPFPIAVTIIVAQDITLIGAETFFAMLGFIWKYYLAVFLLFTFCQLIIIKHTGFGFFKTLNTIKMPIFIAVSTGSSTAAIPATNEALIKGFGFEEKIVNTLVPLGSFMGRFGYVLYFGFTTVFVIQLYGITMQPMDYLLVAIFSIFASISSVGLAGNLALVMLSVTLQPLNLPFGAMIVLFRAIDVIVQPFRTLGVVHTNCALVSMVARKQRQ